ncbi:COG1361 S-layer family protein [Desulfuribacillus alkaliarsenatis]|uniref:CARDB domain-containing protein n=1 Tax=Desulfuribacillus alkaliarsenatis TaxID=766136 RepID=A0A1E5G1T3_9FIRM|nr:hypothetical protein [Desulfuribacillus alkaliarsenatis]OEF96855.1 hypothetical protein BHF68_07285 [Desulfuribacillus alkaliarsenatis]
MRFKLVIILPFLLIISLVFLAPQLAEANQANDNINDNKAEPPIIRLHNTIVPQQNLFSGETSRIFLDLHNTGGMAAKDITVRLHGFSPHAIYMKGPIKDTFKLSELKPNHYNDSVFFDITTIPTLSSGIYTLDVTFEYRDEFNQQYSRTYQAFLPVVRRTVSESQAQLNITNIQHPTAEIRANQDFTISFTVSNTSTLAARNIRVSVDGGTVILPKSTPIQSIPVLSPGESKTLSYTMFPTANANTRNHPVEILVEFDTDTNSSANNLKQSFSQFVGINIANNTASNNTVSNNTVVSNSNNNSNNTASNSSSISNSNTDSNSNSNSIHGNDTDTQPNTNSDIDTQARIDNTGDYGNTDNYANTSNSEIPNGNQVSTNSSLDMITLTTFAGWGLAVLFAITLLLQTWLVLYKKS